MSKSIQRKDAMDKLGEAMAEVRSIWTTPDVRETYENACKQFRSLKTRNKNLLIYKEVAVDCYRPVLVALYEKLGLELPVEFQANIETHKVLAQIEKLKQGQRLAS